MTSRVLVTGGAGFIGTHTVVDLVDGGYEVVVLDDFSNSSPTSIERVRELAGGGVTFAEVDVTRADQLDAVFRAQPIDAVIHFAARKAVGESVELPIEYYETNVGATLAVLRAMRAHDVRKLVFSSSCAICGAAEELPIVEDTPPNPANPYARSKWMCEQIVADAAARHDDWAVVSLRYFNPVGAHPSARLGEDPRGVPNNLMPYLMQVAVGRLPKLSVFGDDYPTIDGTGVRDYVHVMDLARGHRDALDYLDRHTGARVVNLGTGRGTSVLELVGAFSRASGREIPYEIVGRRPGDVAELVADPRRAEAELGWTATREVAAMCADAWAFQRENPFGYDGG